LAAMLKRFCRQTQPMANSRATIKPDSLILMMAGTSIRTVSAPFLSRRLIRKYLTDGCGDLGLEERFVY
jgi:hypothetical protein